MNKFIFFSIIIFSNGIVLGAEKSLTKVTYKDTIEFPKKTEHIFGMTVKTPPYIMDTYVNDGPTVGIILGTELCLLDTEIDKYTLVHDTDIITHCCINGDRVAFTTGKNDYIKITNTKGSKPILFPQRADNIGALYIKDNIVAIAPSSGGQVFMLNNDKQSMTVKREKKINLENEYSVRKKFFGPYLLINVCNKVYIWNIDTDEEICINPDEEILFENVNPDGNLVITCMNKVQVWNMKKQSKTEIGIPNPDMKFPIEAYLYGNMLIAGMEGKVYVTNIVNKIQTLLDHRNYVGANDIMRKPIIANNILYIASNYKVFIWNLRTKDSVHILQTRDFIQDMFMKNNKLFVVQKNHIKIYDIK